LAILCARLLEHVTLKARPDGNLVAAFDQHNIQLGKLGARARERAQQLRSGVPLRSFTSDRSKAGREIDRLVRRLARSGLIEFCLSVSDRDAPKVVIEPQMPDYWPRAASLRDTDVLMLSRFAYMRRRSGTLVLESPRAGALFRIHDAKIAGMLAALSQPQQIKRLRHKVRFWGVDLLSLLLDSHILIKVDRRRSSNLRQAEGDTHLALWDFHDLLFHARSTEGRHANPIGGTYAHADDVPPLPAVRPSWPGKKIDLRKLATRHPPAAARVMQCLQQRRSTRLFDDREPITLVELAHFLDGTARVQSHSRAWAVEKIAAVEYAPRPYPSAGASYELELYLAVHRCEGLARGFYYYDAGAHSIVPIPARPDELEMLLRGAAYAMGVSAPPQVLITIAARFGRVAWKYSALAYGLILKDTGVLMQTFYLMSTEMGLGGCAIGLANIDLFEKMTGVEFHIEGPLGQFALGRAIGAEA
jgi:SagB-type dehydrogenase family enzyme